MTFFGGICKNTHSVLLPYNPTMMQNPQYAADFTTLLDVCRQKKVAVQTIKALSRGPWGDRPRTNTTWYEPFTEQADIDLAVHWALRQPDVFLNTVGDVTLLPKVLDAAVRFTEAQTQAEIEAALSHTEMTPLFITAVSH